MSNASDLCEMQVRLCEIQARLLAVSSKVDTLLEHTFPPPNAQELCEIQSRLLTVSNNVDALLEQVTYPQPDTRQHEIHRKLDVLLTVNDKMDTLLAMIAPVHAHAAWVDTLRKRLSTIGLVKDRRITNET